MPHKTSAPTLPLEPSAVGSPRAYYLVNPGGIIHSCSREYALAHLRLPGWRQATAEEVQALAAADGFQDPSHLICKPWAPQVLEDQDQFDG